MTNPPRYVLAAVEVVCDDAGDFLQHLCVDPVSNPLGVAVRAGAETGLGSAAPLCGVGERVVAVLAVAVLVLVVERVEHDEVVLLVADAACHGVPNCLSGFSAVDTSITHGGG